MARSSEADASPGVNSPIVITVTVWLDKAKDIDIDTQDVPDWIAAGALIRALDVLDPAEEPVEIKEEED